MIKTVLEKQEACYGCTACEKICPTGAIQMLEDEEGFFYPVIDEKKCIGCNLCKKACQALNHDPIQNDSQEYYAVKLRDEEERMKSRSGGIFFSLANRILKEKGTVYGAAFDEELKVNHIRATTEAEVNACRGSKYVQSNLKEVFKQVEVDLKSGAKVLFSGTSCQVEGLRKYLNLKSDINQENLYLCDIVCHGTPSPKIYQDYLKFVREKHKKEIKSFDFRNKNFGWRGHVETIKFEDGSEVTQDYFKNIFYSNYILRPSCYTCQHTSLDRVADITIADCWGIENVNKDWDDNKGVSLVILNTKKGKELFKNVSEEIDCISVDIQKCMQPNLKHPTQKPENRQSFWNLYEKKGIKRIINKYGKLPIRKKN